MQEKQHRLGILILRSLVMANSIVYRTWRVKIAQVWSGVIENFIARLPVWFNGEATSSESFGERCGTSIPQPDHPNDHDEWCWQCTSSFRSASTSKIHRKVYVKCYLHAKEPASVRSPLSQLTLMDDRMIVSLNVRTAYCCPSLHVSRLHCQFIHGTVRVIEWLLYV